MSTSATGQRAEAVVAGQLQADGYEILDRNWKNRFCEIDIVVRKAGIIYFVEVKYRATAAQGGGLEYVTRVKLQKMQFAANQWLAIHRVESDYSFMAAAVGGPDFVIDELVPLDFI